MPNGGEIRDGEMRVYPIDENGNAIEWVGSPGAKTNIAYLVFHPEQQWVKASTKAVTDKLFTIWPPKSSVALALPLFWTTPDSDAIPVGEMWGVVIHDFRRLWQARRTGGHADQWDCAFRLEDSFTECGAHLSEVGENAKGTEN